MASVHSARYREFLDRLRAARREANLTQVQAAALLAKPQSYVSKCESGERRVDVIELEEFARTYAKPLAYFLARAELAPQPRALPAELAQADQRHPRGRRAREAPRRRPPSS